MVQMMYKVGRVVDENLKVTGVLIKDVRGHLGCLILLVDK